MKHGKKYVDGAKLIERSRLYDTQEALDWYSKVRRNR